MYVTDLMLVDVRLPQSCGGRGLTLICTGKVAAIVSSREGPEARIPRVMRPTWCFVKRPRDEMEIGNLESRHARVETLSPSFPPITLTNDRINSDGHWVRMELMLSRAGSTRRS